MKSKLLRIGIAGLVLLSVILSIAIASCSGITNRIVTKKIQVSSVPSVIIEFNSTLQPMLAAIPIKTRSDVFTSMALTCLNVKQSQVCILVCPNFSTLTQSFQNDLLAHEYLNIIGAQQVNLTQFNIDVQTWYNDPTSGTPTVTSNYFKYALWFNLYRPEGIKESEYNKKIDTYAFIGDILNKYPRISYKLPTNIQMYYKGVLNSLN